MHRRLFVLVIPLLLLAAVACDGLPVGQPDRLQARPAAPPPPPDWPGPGPQCTPGCPQGDTLCLPCPTEK